MSNSHAHQAATEHKLTVSRTIEAPVRDIFNILTLPANHPKFDGSGFVRSALNTERIKEVGDVFTMNMEGEHMGGEYQMENHVVAFAENKLVGWQPAAPKSEPKGWEWVYELTSVDADTTEVTLTYDWSKVTDKELLKKVSFPLVKEDSLEQSLQLLSEVSTAS
ncbi:uncharacterized protein YndB with AHSA1/START domain [Neomicrococcus aestuarii]|uniref:Uncharacterized protein YndB with AHSA1/START domain n=1 Tax=Neomicrococcus aestuarii TaxID=556325 RepID=A0A7W8TV55_9MICC|nr:SRPBCC family protein [Neomicrococcus aestuarii]MBB5513368.1 uncharacterized protein YndB with AHSA1/START domain [Neomicrococcus aestuarii]